jgi:protoporphyrin/coproporphyrin ferrochelatase
MSQAGLLIVNLGTPHSYQLKDVFKYLNEFLTDGRVIDFPWIKRQFLARGVIVPFRFRQSAQLYKQLWTEEGSPLLVHGKAVRDKLQEMLGDSFKVVLAMRYQNPSIASGLEELRQAGVKEIIVFPLFPQYASATTGSVHQKIMEHIKHWQVIPKMTFINSYPDHPSLVHAFYEVSRKYSISAYDHLLFSFHGLPERQLHKANPSKTCLQGECCQALNARNQFCYKAQCFATAYALADKLGLKKTDYTISFQSRLGKEPWIQPYTTDVLQACIEKGYKRLLVFCPAFVCDCLETTCEISHEYAAEFKKMGGEELQLVEGLNSHPAWIEAIRSIVLEQAGK